MSFIYFSFHTRCKSDRAAINSRLLCVEMPPPLKVVVPWSSNEEDQASSQEHLRQMDLMMKADRDLADVGADIASVVEQVESLRANVHGVNRDRG